MSQTSSALRAPSVRTLTAGLVLFSAAIAFGLPRDVHAMPHGPGGPGAEAPAAFFMHGPALDKALDSVKATDAQKAQIRSISDAARKELKAQRDAGRTLREQSIQLFTQPTIDANAAEALRQQQLAQHDQASRRMLQAMIDIGNVLTPDQRKQLAENMAKKRQEMAARHGGRHAPNDAAPR